MNKRAATLEKEAEQSRLETARIKLQISWREITPAQRHKIIGVLKSHPLSIDVVCVGSDPEACEYAQQLVAVLKASGSNPKFVKLLAASNNPSGLLLGGTSGPDMELLGTAFRMAGIHFSAGRNIPNLEIRIGTKPHAQ
ncbi:MAG: hypothetical protein HY753_03485 [Nitrospirae bacterium]|nr:hypothetical protein [Nitrospirota bacterium]